MSMDPKVIYENKYLMVLDKPSGWIVNKAQSTKSQITLQDYLEKRNYPLAKNFSKRSGIVHRLDKGTSGLIIIAKKKETFEALQAQFKKRSVKKEYTCLVHGLVAPLEGGIKAPIGRLPWNRERFGVFPGGKPAESKFKVVKTYTNDHKYTLLNVYPRTGRTHQIRVHMKYIGHPIVADPFYAGRKTSKRDNKWCPRLFLHASSIEFTHPVTGKKISAKSDLPKELESVLKKLET